MLTVGSSRSALPHLSPLLCLQFYELYEDDAQLGHDILDWKLTLAGKVCFGAPYLSQSQLLVLTPIFVLLQVWATADR